MNNFEPTGLGLTIFKDRYARTDTETWDEACHRVAEHVAQAENNGKVKLYADRFYGQLVQNYFNPGGRIWYGAGRPKSQLNNCFVVSTSDSREGWGKTTSDIIVISGLMGGVGLNVSPIRPRGYPIKGTGGVATGAVSLMQLINSIGNVIVGGGGRRMALMLCLDITHPDLEEFLEAKLDLNELNNANISVVIPSNMSTEQFVDMVRNEEYFELEFNGMPSGAKLNARWLWNKLVENSWVSGEPGVLNGYLANKMNTISYLKPLISTNPSMPAGTLVATRDGIYPIEQLDGKIFQVKSLDGTWAKAECFLSGENEEVLEIKFGDNRVTHSTKEHRWPVLGRLGRIHKVYAHELQPGDLIPLNRNEAPGICGDMSLTREDGFFIGYLLGDGWISKRSSNGQYAMGIVFGAEERYMAERLLRYINSRKQNASTITEGKDGELYIQATDQSFIQDIIDTFGYDITKSTIPSKIWTSNDECIAGFIDGWLSADGCVSEPTTKAPCIILSTSREQLALEFSKLISFWGISSNINGQTQRSSFPNGKDYNKNYVRWNVKIGSGSISLFANVLTISNEKKAQRINDILQTRTFRPSPETQFVQVISVKSVGRAKVWDISVDYEQHVFPSQYCYTGNCGEQWLEEYGSCNLGALVLPRFIKDGELDWDQLDESVRLGVRFLDNVITINHYPLPEIKENCENVRRVGLGVMGLHTMLLELGMKYDSPEAFEFIDHLFAFIKNTAYDASVNLAIERGPFPAYDQRYLETGFIKTLKRGIRSKIKEHGIRNCALLTIAPTGTTSMVSGVSSGIEPLPPAVYWRNYYKPTKTGTRELTRELVVEESFYKYPDLVQSAIDVPVRSHFEMQKIVQKHIDNAVSKTINLANDFPKDQFGDVWLEYLPYLKGTTVYRYGSRENEPINPVPREEWENVIAANRASDDSLTADEFMSMDCPGGSCELKLS